VSTATSAEEIDLLAVHQQLVEIEQKAAEATTRHNQFLQELGLPLI
jgi:type I restriction enzyme M protein